MNKLLLHQPGRNGDILICLPIAYFYTREGYDVDWLCPKEYHNLFRNITYCRPVDTPEPPYQRTIDISFGLNTKGDAHKWWVATRDTWESFVTAKYHLAKVPLGHRWYLEWKRDFKRENELLDIIINKYGEPFNIAHERTHDAYVEINIPNKVPFAPIGDYNIFDWYKVLCRAKEIHAQDSSLANFVEVLPELYDHPKYIYHTHHRDQLWGRTILKNNWKFKGGPDASN